MIDWVWSCGTGTLRSPQISWFVQVMNVWTCPCDCASGSAEFTTRAYRVNVAMRRSS
jgi:hypothetical protein